MEIFYLQYEAEPTIKSDDYNLVGGAFINCWVKSNTLQSAKEIAEENIKDNNWLVLNLEEYSPVSNNSYNLDDNSLEHYKQAEVDGEVYVYHSWPNEPQEGSQH